MTRLASSIYLVAAWMTLAFSAVESLVAEEVIVYWQKKKSPTESTIFSTGSEVIRGEMVGFDDNRFIVQIAGQEQPFVMPSSQIAGVKVLWDDEQMQQANAALHIGNYGEAIQKLQTIIEQSDAQPWKQKLLLLEIAAAATRLEKLRIATRVCSLVHASKAPLFVNAYAPIQWTSDPIAKEAIEELATFASDPSPIIQIVVCSWNLSSPDQATYIKKLEVIAQNQKDTAGVFAAVQLWRTIPPQEFIQSKLAEAIRVRDSLPYCLQAGPTAVIADRIERSGNYELAFDYWLETVLMSPNQAMPIVHIAARHLDQLAMQGGIGNDWPELKAKIFNLDSSN